MRLAGKRFWTWISVAILSVFVKGEGDALAQGQSTTNNQSSTSQLKHNVPRGPHSKTDKVVDKMGTSNAYKLNTSRGTAVGLKTTGSGQFKQDASSKDAAKMTLKTNLKTTSAIGEKRDLGTQSGLKTSSRKAVGDDTPTESSKTLKPRGKTGSTPNPAAVTHRRQH